MTDALEEYKRHVRIADQMLSDDRRMTAHVSSVSRELADAAIAELEWMCEQFDSIAASHTWMPTSGHLAATYEAEHRT